MAHGPIALFMMQMGRHIHLLTFNMVNQDHISQDKQLFLWFSNFACCCS